MRKAVRKQDVAKMVGKSVYAVKKDGSVVRGKLVRVSGGKLFISVSTSGKGRKVQTSAILPLVLFDLLAVGTGPYAGGYGYGGYPGYPGYFGYPGYPGYYGGGYGYPGIW